MEAPLFYRLYAGNLSRVSAAEAFAPMGPLEILQRTDRYDPRRIDLRVRHVIVTLDVIDVDRLLDSRILVEVAEIAVEIGIVGDAAQIAFEMPDVDRIEADQRYKEPPIRLDRMRAEEIPPLGKARLEPVEHGEDAIGRVFIRALRGGEPL
jgi:hypothetical protein